MKKLIFPYTILLFFCLLSTGYSQDIEDIYFPIDGELSGREAKALEQIEGWRSDKSTDVKPVMTSDGAVKFYYGTSQPIVSCAVLQVTDIELEMGERVTSLHLGDTVRWHLEPAVTGDGGNEIQHLIVKALETNMSTSLVIATNRRTYHMLLKSYRKQYMPKVSFIYPNDLLNKWISQRDIREKQYEKKLLKGSQENIETLDFDYKMSGRGKWTPTRVYNDGVRTIIQMPEKMINGEAPSLLVLRSKTNEEVLVNYRIHKDRYIVDTVFDKAILIAGVGQSQEKITIERIFE